MVNRVVDFPLEDLAGGEQTVSREGIFANLVFAVVGDSQDLVSGTKPQKLGSASRRNSRDGMGWYSSSNSTDGVYYALPADHPLYSIGIEITIFQIAQIDSWAAYSSLLCVPYQNGSWADPYGAFGLQRDNTANTIRLWGYGGTSTYISNTTSLTVTSGGRRAIGAARYANGCRFLINGQYDDSVAGVNRSSAFSWTNKQPLVILNRSNSNAGEGTTGSAPVTLIFGRALTEPEMRWLADNWREVVDIEDAVAPLPTAGGGDVTTSLSGEAATASAGTLANSRTVAASGQAVTASAGTIAPSLTIALSGQAVTASAGTVTQSKAAALSGQAATASAGTLGETRTVALSGQAATASAGTVTYTADGNVTLALSGQAVAASAGAIAPAATIATSGQAATASAGTAAAGMSIAASGTQITTAAGTLTLGIVVPLSGQAAAAGAGTVTYSTAGAVVVALTGQAVEASAGTMSYAEQILSAAPIGHGPGMSRRSPSKGGSRAPQLSTRTR